MTYKFQVHKKVEFNRRDRLNVDKDSLMEKFIDVLFCLAIIMSTLVGFFVVTFPTVIFLSFGNYLMLVLHIVVMLLIGGVLVFFFSVMRPRNSTLTLSETEAHVEENSIWGKIFYKSTTGYDRVCKVYHTDVCPIELTPMAKIRRNPQAVYDVELWRRYNGSYIVAEDAEVKPVFGAVYREEIWQFLKEHCKNATFFTKEEYLADLEKKRALDREHDAYSKNYDGYVN